MRHAKLAATDGFADAYRENDRRHSHRSQNANNPSQIGLTMVHAEGEPRLSPSPWSATIRLPKWIPRG